MLLVLPKIIFFSMLFLLSPFRPSSFLYVEEKFTGPARFSCPNNWGHPPRSAHITASLGARNPRG